MARDLERLVAELVAFIACGGDRGCSVEDVLGAIDRHLGDLQPPSSSSRFGREHNARAHSTIWKWLARRPEICVGHSRQFNHLSLDQLGLLQHDGGDNEEKPNTSLKDGSRTSNLLPRVYATNKAQWEFIAGHSQDFTRVLQLEWQLLQGVATTRSEGILQGDLCRLVEQDKRSVPKRTDSLVKKGYLTKRTTLIRGTKTSKLWLISLAPALAKDEDAPSSVELNSQAPQPALTNDLEPVPWSNQWTGQSLDFAALTTTIMAIAKQWGVIRLHHLKLKLGVLGQRWHMKVLAKLCRALNAQGAIRYTAATLDGRVFKDCIQYVRDLVPQDLAVLFAAGKHREQPVEPSYDIDKQDSDQEDHLTIQGINASQLASLPSWTPDKPLASFVTDVVSFFKSSGVTNPELISLSLGPSFARFIASLTSSFAASGTQPDRLAHVRMTSEHKRDGKVASYRYFILGRDDHSSQTPQIECPRATNLAGDNPMNRCAYGFSPGASKPLHVASLASLVGSGLVNYRSAAKPRLPSKGAQDGDSAEISVTESNTHTWTANDQDDLPLPISTTEITRSTRGQKAINPGKEVARKHSDQEGHGSQPSNDARPRLSFTPSDQPLVKVDESVAVSEVRGKSLIVQPLDNNVDGGISDDEVSQKAQQEVVDGQHGLPVEGSLPRGEWQPAQHSERGGLRGRGRGKRGRLSTARARTGAKPWVCEKCGGSWKNDLGLKYHQQKARTSCNPSFDPTAEAPRRGKKPKYASILLKDAPAEPTGTLLQEHLGIDGRPRELRLRRQARLVLDDSDGDGGRCSEEEGDKFDPKDRSEENLPTISTTRRRPIKGLKETLPARTPADSHQLHFGDGALLPTSRMASRHMCIEDIDTTDARTSQALPSNLPILSTIPSAETSREGPETQQDSEVPSHHTPIVMSNAAKPATSIKEAAITKTNVVSPHKISRSDILKKVTSIVDACFPSNEVAIPGGDVITRIIQSIWSREHDGSREITQKECQAALRQLFRRKVLAEHWHAFRNRFGSFSKCQFITRPAADPFSRHCLELVEAMKAAHPRLYFPVEYAYASEPPGVRPGRRNLPTELAVLDAPVYAAQIAVKRALEAEDSKVHRPRKRRRWNSTVGASPEREASPDWGANINGIQWMTEAHQPEHIDYGPTYTMAQYSPGFELDELHFLEPNTYLNEEQPELRADPTPSKGQLTDRHTFTLGAIPVEFSLVEPTTVIQGFMGRWPDLDTQDFEDDNHSFTMRGWIPDPSWHLWASRAKQLAKPPKKASARKTAAEDFHYQRFCQHLKKIKRLEVSRADDFIHFSSGAAGPFNIFITLESPPSHPSHQPYQLTWIEDAAHEDRQVVAVGTESDSPDSSEDELQVDPRLKVAYEGITNSKLASYANLIGVKRVMLTTRNLSDMPPEVDAETLDESSSDLNDFDELLAAFIAVRSLLGGVDKSIDWGILAKLFPAIGPEGLRTFWHTVSHSHSRYIANYTQDFQTKFLEAYEKNEVPVLDFEDPATYDWASLVHWTMQLANDPACDMPADMNMFKSRFKLDETPDKTVEWRNDFFHPQSSLFSRFEWAVSEPSAVNLQTFSNEMNDLVPITDILVIRSWVRSLCCAPEGRFSTEEIKAKFLSVSTVGADRANALLAEAIDQLTEEKVIRRNPKPPLGGRPYQLSESFNAALEKLAHRDKYLQAASCKARMDIAFRRGDTFRISYALDDGATMAITSLNAAQRVVLRPVELPDIPFGFEPGNYESRKYPKRYYHFELEVVPTDSYLYDEDIEILREIHRNDAAVGSVSGELPQWINFVGDIEHQRWATILAAFCFALATRGPMTIEAICNALDPILEPCEAVAIIRWGRATGVLESLALGIGTTVGEWWWLAVAHVLSERSGLSPDLAENTGD